MATQDDLSNIVGKLLSSPTKVPAPNNATEQWLLNAILNLKAAMLLNDIKVHLMHTKVETADIKYDEVKYQEELDKLFNELTKTVEDSEKAKLTNVARKDIIIPSGS